MAINTIHQSCLVLLIFVSTTIFIGTATLTPDYYDNICPPALLTIRQIVQAAIAKEPRMGASLLRLHFHDCFVNGCDGSVLLDDTPFFRGEKTAGPNLNSARGFEVIDQIKDALNKVCFGNVVSCADILAVVARDSVNILGGPSWPVYLGRLDSRTVSFDAANNDIPNPNMNLQALIDNFGRHKLSLQDLVVLSGAHSIGFARCTNYLSRIQNDPNIDPLYKADLARACPNPATKDNNTNPLDFTPAFFDSVYYQKLMHFRGLLHSDQELFRGNIAGAADALVNLYAGNVAAWWMAFGPTMIKMGSLGPPPGEKGEIRFNCRKIN